MPQKEPVQLKVMTSTFTLLPIYS